jgi:hypothetical protein
VHDHDRAPAFQQSRRERKKIEMRFAHMKRVLSCTASTARVERRENEVLLTATAQNLRRLVKFLPCPAIGGSGLSGMAGA